MIFRTGQIVSPVTQGIFLQTMLDAPVQNVKLATIQVNSKRKFNVRSVRNIV